MIEKLLSCPECGYRLSNTAAAHTGGKCTCEICGKPLNLISFDGRVIVYVSRENRADSVRRPVA